MAGVCLGIASKCEGREINESDICFCADNTFEVSDVRKTEDTILLLLEWKLAFPTLLDFVKEYDELASSKSSGRETSMKQFLSELALQCPVSLIYRPSTLAACIVSLSAYLTGIQPIWPRELEEITGYKWFDLEDCMLELCDDLKWMETSMPELTMVHRRYHKHKRAWVAQGFSAPHISSFNTLTNQRNKRLNA